MSNISANSPESFPMNGGDGPYSYTKNSTFQRQAVSVTKTTVDEVIATKLDIEKLGKNTFSIADLGCSIGPNTFIAMQNIIDAVKHKYYSVKLESKVPEFHVFFNDHTSNDFNTLFATLPPLRPYVAAGVPGSFHGRLFPRASLEFVHSSYALQWLSKLPEELLDRNSRAWNKGRVHYACAAEEVADAYAAQYCRDMEVFLDARADELVAGGIMVLIIPAIRDGIPHSSIPSGVMFDLMGSSLMDMVKEGLIPETDVDSFNLPVYATSPKEIGSIVERNGCFSIERMELTSPGSIFNEKISGKAIAMHLRAGMEGIISKHFGSSIIDQLFDRLVNKCEEFSHQLQSSYTEGTQLFVVLTRN